MVLECRGAQRLSLTSITCQQLTFNSKHQLTMFIQNVNTRKHSRLDKHSDLTQPSSLFGRMPTCSDSVSQPHHMLNPQEKLQQDCGGTTNTPATFHRGLDKDLGSSLTQSASADYATTDGKQQHSAVQASRWDWMPWKGDKRSACLLQLWLVTFPSEAPNYDYTSGMLSMLKSPF